jgi:hypothetical protein
MKTPEMAIRDVGCSDTDGLAIGQPAACWPNPLMPSRPVGLVHDGASAALRAASVTSVITRSGLTSSRAAHGSVQQ